MTRTVYFSDVFLGLCWGLKNRGIEKLDSAENRLDYTLEQTKPTIKRITDKEGLNLNFPIRTHPIHGDSTFLGRELRALNNGLVTLIPNSTIIQLNFTEEELAQKLGKNPIPLKPQDYREITTDFLSHYESFRPAHLHI
jgi:hypothetical protein